METTPIADQRQYPKPDEPEQTNKNWIQQYPSVFKN